MIYISLQVCENVFFIQICVSLFTSILTAPQWQSLRSSIAAGWVGINQTTGERKLNCTLGIFVRIFHDNDFWRISLVAGNGLSEAACHRCGLPWQVWMHQGSDCQLQIKYHVQVWCHMLGLIAGPDTYHPHLPSLYRTAPELFI